jgi:hypothetical protein
MQEISQHRLCQEDGMCFKSRAAKTELVCVCVLVNKLQELRCTEQSIAQNVKSCICMGGVLVA